MKLLVSGIPSPHFLALRMGEPDANGQTPLRRPSLGYANPCRHCLQLIGEGEDKLVLAYRPFLALQPYAESGPIFLHARDCERFEGSDLPAWMAYLDPALVRGYDREDWIVYESAEVVRGVGIADACRRALAREDVAYVHVRSKFNCFQCRVDRG